MSDKTDVLGNPYEAAAQGLKDRILALIPGHPKILTIESVWDLFKVPEFYCDDLGPSMAQAMGALSLARAEWRRSRAGGGAASDWTTEKPTGPGFYWHKQEDGGGPEPCVVAWSLESCTLDAQFMTGTACEVADTAGWWAPLNCLDAPAFGATNDRPGEGR